VSHATVFSHPKAVLTLLFLNKLVILCMCWEVKVNVAHFVLLSAFTWGVV
jgi:hypothetical protein